MDGGGVEAARHVGPPRTLDVQQFAAARSTEVQALYNALKVQQEANNSSGVSGHLSASLTTPRHLRRRTASHNRRIPFRWMHNSAQSGKRKKRQRDASSSFHLQSNVALTAVEGETSSSKRKKAEKRLPSRRIRRRIELQGVREGTVSCMRDGTRRLATHVWHAKRFPMANSWGYRLPQGLPGKGHGSKAVFNWVKEAAVLHDASYIGIIELEGTKDGILQILDQLLEPSPGRPVSGWPAEEEEMHGLLYGNAVLHNAGKVPREAIAPVTTLWRPSSSEGRDTSDHSTGSEGRGEERQLWIWVHPIAFDDAFLALSTACERQGLDDPRAFVKCRSRRGELARLEILGSKALQVLQKVLRPVPRKVAYTSSTEIAGLSGHQEANKNRDGNTSPNVSQSLSSRIFAKADCLPAAAVIALDVYDPRDTPRSFYSVTNASVSASAQARLIDSNLPGDTPFSGDLSMEEEVGVQNKKPNLGIEEEEDVMHWESLLEKGQSKEVSDSPHLWSPPAEGMVPALSQKSFCKKRQKRRKAYFVDVNEDFSLPGLESGAPDRTEEQDGACPILLLKQAHFRTSASGWSIIVPITWVHAFWVPLVFAGGHVIGLRERHWLATDAGLPYFPHDFPDCPAHAQHLGAASAAFNSANQARPPSQRSPSFSVSPLQWSVMNAYKDHTLDGSGRNTAVASELIFKEAGEQSIEETDTTPGAIPMLKDLDGDTAMTEAGITVARAPSPPASDSVVSEFMDLAGDTEMGGNSDTVVRSPVSLVGCQTVHEGVFHQPDTPVPDDSAKEECSADRVSSLLVTPHGPAGAVLRESPKLERVTAIPGFVTVVTASPVSLATCQTVDGAVIADLTNLGEDIAMTGTTNLFTSSPVSSTFCQSVDGAVIPELSKVEEAGAITETGVIVSKPPLPPATCQAVEGVGVPELTKALGDNAVREADSLPNDVPPLQAAAVEATFVRCLTSVDGDSAVFETDINVALPPSLEIAAEGLSPSRQLTKPPGVDAAVMGDVLKDGLNSWRVGSQLQQPVIDAHDSDKFDCGRLSSGGKAFIDEEIIDTPPINMPRLEVPGPVATLTNSYGRDQSPIPLPSSPGEHLLSASNSNLNSVMKRSTLPIFVARTADALRQVFKENDLQHTLLLCSGSMKYRGAQNGLKTGTLEWRASQKPIESAVCTSGSKIQAVVGGHLKGCYVRVLMVVPRKGVMKENGVLCSPTKEDFDCFLSRSQRWQGIDASWVSPQAKELKKRKVKRKGKGKGKEKGKTKGEEAGPPSQSNPEAEEFAKVTTHLDVRYDECSNREIIGCITSTGPEGSLWSGTGICEVGSLMKLRAMQWQDERWWNKNEILLLAGSQLSPILRPVVVSVVLETGPQEDVMC